MTRVDLIIAALLGGGFALGYMVGAGATPWWGFAIGAAGVLGYYLALGWLRGRR